MFSSEGSDGRRALVSGVTALLFVTLALVICMKKLARPPHVFVNHEGVRGPEWFLAWDEIQAASFARELELVLQSPYM